MLLPDIDAVQSGAGDTQQSYFPENTCVRQVGAPVPAKHTVGFPDVDKAVHGVFGAKGPAFCKCIPDKFKGGMKEDFQLISCLFQDMGHIVFPDTVHIICRPHLGTVEINISNGVQPVKTEQNSAAGQQFFFRVKTRHILIIFFHQGQRTDFIVFPERVFHLPPAQQIRIDRPRNSCGP